MMTKDPMENIIPIEEEDSGSQPQVLGTKAC